MITFYSDVSIIFARKSSLVVYFQVLLVTGFNRELGTSDEWFTIGNSLIISPWSGMIHYLKFSNSYMIVGLTISMPGREYNSESNCLYFKRIFFQLFLFSLFCKNGTIL
jgi:hypothetical protein